jgi:MazG family protein
MQRLRGPAGCPWDREQTHQTLIPCLVEETYELVEAVEAEQADAVCEELGDLLLQVVFHAQLASERGEYDLAQVTQGIVDKLRYRHPHVFGDVEVADSDEVVHNWEQLKAAAYGEEQRPSALDGVPPGLPALQRGQKLHKRAAKVGFDWADLRGPRAKLDEELAELDEAIATGDPARIEHELGDLLASAVNLARFLRLDAEQAMRAANRRFEDRFRQVEAAAQAQGRSLPDMTLAEMEELWEAAKAAENHAS